MLLLFPSRPGMKSDREAFGSGPDLAPAQGLTLEPMGAHQAGYTVWNNDLASALARHLGRPA